MDERRRGAAALVALSAGAFLFSAYFSARAPCGSWDNSVFGARMWNEGDPGGYYLASAHALFYSGGRLLYPGHPGLPLQILLHAVQAVYFLISAPVSLDFTAFVARHIAQVFFLSKLLMTCLHILSFWLLYAFARKALDRDRAALLCVLGYATSLPVLYYLSRISVEPLVAVFFLSTFLALWECEESLVRGRRGRALAMAALAGAAAVSGLATKFHLLWPLPLVGLLSMRKARRSALLAYAASAALAFALYSILLDWRDFFAYWDVSGMGGSAAEGLSGLARRQLGVFPAITRGLARIPLENWLPGRTKSGLFLFCELPLLAAAAYGMVRASRGVEKTPKRLGWPATAAVYTVLIWAYRAAGVSGDFHDFHYLFVFMLLACVFFGTASDALLTRLKAAPGSRKEASLIFLWLVAIHFASIWAAFDTRARDAGYYRLIRAFPDALASAPAGERVAVIGSRPFSVARLLGLGVLRDTPPTSSRLLDAVSTAFTFGEPIGPGIGAVVEVSKVNGVDTAVLRAR